MKSEKLANRIFELLTWVGLCMICAAIPLGLVGKNEFAGLAFLGGVAVIMTGAFSYVFIFFCAGLLDCFRHRS